MQIIEPTLEQLRIIKNRFQNELREASVASQYSRHNFTSLSFIPNRLPPQSIVKNGELFQVFVMGGTIFQSVICKKNDRIVLGFEYQEKMIYSTLPTIESTESLADYLMQFITNKIEKIVLNFAYPLKPTLANNVLDGELIEISGEKALVAHDLVGKKVGEKIGNILTKKIGRSIIVSVANDGVCLLASGLDKNHKCNLAFGIVGTGLNSGFMLNRDTIINIESAKFDKFTPSEVGVKLAKFNLGSPYGREVNAKFLYIHFNQFLLKDNILYNPLHSTEELSELASDSIPIVSEIARKTMYRSAALFACQIAGITSFLGKDMRFIMEGSLFWKGHGYKDTVMSITKKLTSFNVEFILVPNSSVVGATKIII